MAYGSGESSLYFCLKSAKNFLPSGPNLAGSSVAIVHLKRGAMSGGTLSSGLADAFRQLPSPANSLRFGLEAAASFSTWLPLNSISPVQMKQSALIWDASDS